MRGSCTQGRDKVGKPVLVISRRATAEQGTGVRDDLG